MTRRVVFASGKGGTGKTTLTTAMALLAARENRIALADCDVEAANLSIALRAHDIIRESFSGWPAAALDTSLCNSCGTCQNVCRFQAISRSAARHDFSIDPFMCEGCGRCASACPYHAITMRPRESGEVVEAKTEIGPLVYGRLRPGQDLSGKLVTEVRARADKLAQETEAALVVIDGPPGTGCPATAAIANTDLLVAVTEPTLSGEHDLLRLIALARRLAVPVEIILNKADLSERGAQRIHECIAAESLSLIAEIPYDAELAGLAQHAALAMAMNTKADGGTGLHGLRAICEAWDTIRTSIDR